MEVLKSIFETLQTIPNVYVASISIIGAAIVRMVEKKKLRKKGKLRD